MVPPKTALFIYEANAGDRDRDADRVRRDRILQAHPPRPHLTPCACDACQAWARAIVASPLQAGDGS